MTQDNRKYTAAAILMFVSAALHLPVAAIAYADHGPQLIVAAVLWAALGLGLLRQLRWCAYLAFFGMLVGSIAALSGALGAFGLVAALFWLILAADTLAALILFRVLWAANPLIGITRSR